MHQLSANYYSAAAAATAAALASANNNESIKSFPNFANIFQNINAAAAAAALNPSLNPFSIDSILAQKPRNSTPTPTSTTASSTTTTTIATTTSPTTSSGSSSCNNSPSLASNVLQQTANALANSFYSGLQPTDLYGKLYYYYFTQ